MNESLKVQAHHLERSAYLYIRQSSMRQVIENIESSKRQYALRARAIALGWAEDRVIVIDTNQGESGAHPTSNCDSSQKTTILAGFWFK